MQDTTMTAWFFTGSAFVLFVLSGLVFIRVKEKLPRYVVSATLLLVAAGLVLWGIFWFRLAEWGTF